VSHAGAGLLTETADRLGLIDARSRDKVVQGAVELEGPRETRGPSCAIARDAARSRAAVRT
jgi:hypothetical protein